MPNLTRATRRVQGNIPMNQARGELLLNHKAMVEVQQDTYEEEF